MIYCGRLPQIAESSEALEREDLGTNPDSSQKCGDVKSNPTSHRGQELLVELQQGSSDPAEVWTRYKDFIKESRPPSVRVKCTRQLDEEALLMSDYYVVKKPDFENIKRINPEVIRCPE